MVIRLRICPFTPRPLGLKEPCLPHQRGSLAVKVCLLLSFLQRQTGYSHKIAAMGLLDSQDPRTQPPGEEEEGRPGASNSTCLPPSALSSPPLSASSFPHLPARHLLSSIIGRSEYVALDLDSAVTGRQRLVLDSIIDCVALIE